MREVCRTRRAGIAGYSLLQIHALRLQVQVRTRSPGALKEHHNDSSRGCEMNTIVRAIGVLGLAATLGACAVVPAGPGYVGGPGVAVVRGQCITPRDFKSAQVFFLRRISARISPNSRPV